MPLLTASLDFVRHNKLEVSLCNTSDPDADGCSIIVSLRSSHPECFSVLGSELPDCVLPPGQQCKMLLEVLENSLWCGIDFNNVSMSTHSVEPSQLGWSNRKNPECPGSSSILASVRDAQPSTSVESSNVPFYRLSASQLVGGGSDGDNLMPPTATSGDPCRRRLYGGEAHSTAAFRELELPIQLPHGPVDAATRTGSHRDKYHASVHSTPRNSAPGSPMSSSPSNSARRLSTSHGVGSSEDWDTSRDSSGGRRCFNKGMLVPEVDGHFTKSNDNGSIASHGKILAAAHRYSGCGSDNDTTPQPKFSASIVKSSSNKLQNHCFFIYYERLGDENGCLLAANRWVMMERSKHFLWREKLLCSMQKQQSGHHSRSKGKNYQIPPVLGEPVRWLRNVKVSSAPFPFQAASRRPYSQSSAKMFRKCRQGGGCVMLPYRPFRGDSSGLTNQRSMEFDCIAKHGATTSGSGVDAQPHYVSLNEFSNGMLTVAGSCSLPNNKSSDVNSSLTLSCEQSVLSSLSKDPCLFLSQSLPKQLEFSTSSNAHLTPASSPGFHHARTETDATVQMLDRTICGASKEDCIPLNRIQARQPKSSKQQQQQQQQAGVADVYSSTEDSVLVRERRETHFFEAPGGNLSGRLAEESELHGTAYAEATKSLRGAVISPTRARQRRHSGDDCPPRRAPPTCAVQQMSIPQELGIKTLQRKLGLSQVGDVICDFLVMSCSLLPTALDNGLKTLAGSAQLLAGLIEDSVDILYVVGAPILLALSICLLWIIFTSKYNDGVLDDSVVFFG